MALALFDLDNTLLDGDSDYEWGRFLVACGAVDADAYARANQRFFQQYQAGTLDIYAYARFALRPLAENRLEDLYGWRAAFLEERIRPLILTAARELLDRHRQRGDTLAIVTSTNRFVTEPIAAALGVEHLLATEPEFEHGHFTGRIDGVPCFQAGKVERLERWAAETGHSREGSWFYSDSRNDLALLEQVEHPVAVDPDDTLAAHARERGWRIISLRG